MTTRQYILFFIPTIIWGSTWYAIKFQLGETDPLVSVAFRFMLAGLLLFLFCLATGKKMKFSLREHFFMALLGLSLFGFNYWFVYKAETIFTSGVVAMVFSLIIFFNIFFNAVFLKGRIKSEVIIAAFLGVGGTILLFKNEFKNFNLTANDYIVLLFCLGGLITSSLGNIVSAYNQKKKVPVIQANAYGMVYGGVMMFLFARILGKPVIIDTSINYLISLAYLAIFGSVVAFSAYLKLLGEIGPDRAVYSALLSTAIAMVISTFLEGFRWDVYALVGILLLFSGNILALKMKKLKT
jgi:drug/metabolite transporter (DMT)-like permease